VATEEEKQFCEQRNVKIQINGRVDANSFLHHTSRKRGHKHYSKDRQNRPRSAESTTVCLVNQPAFVTPVTEHYNSKILVLDQR